MIKPESASFWRRLHLEKISKEKMIMRRHPAVSIFALAAVAVAAISCSPVHSAPTKSSASTRAAVKPRPAPLPPIQMSQPNVSATGLEYGGQKQTLRPNGARLDGNAYVKTIGSSALDARADAVALDLADGKPSEIRAIGNVFFHVELPPKAGSNAKPVTVEARCNKATLNPKTRVVTLEGNVDGFYQEQGGAKNLLSGDAVTIQQVGDQFVSSVQGNVRVVVPAEMVSGSNQNFGAITITAQRSDVDQKTGVLTFSGNARARSEGGANDFDVAAPSFSVMRGASGTIDTLKTSGKTLIKIDLPPEPSRTGAAATPEKGAASAGRPTHVEAIADSATVLRGAANTLILEGDVKGFYRLQPAGAAAADYRFNGDRAVIKYARPENATGAALVPEGLQVEVTGTPSAIQAPSFGLEF